MHPFGFLNSTSHRFCWLYIHWLPFWKRRAAASHRWWKLSRRLLCVDRLLRAKCQLLSLFIHAPCHQRHSAPLRPPYFFPTDPDNQRGTEWPPLWDTEGEQTRADGENKGWGGQNDREREKNLSGKFSFTPRNQKKGCEMMCLSKSDIKTPCSGPKRATAVSYGRWAAR